MPWELTIEARREVLSHLKLLEKEEGVGRSDEGLRLGRGGLQARHRPLRQPWSERQPHVRQQGATLEEFGQLREAGSRVQLRRRRIRGCQAVGGSARSISVISPTRPTGSNYSVSDGGILQRKLTASGNHCPGDRQWRNGSASGRGPRRWTGRYSRCRLSPSPPLCTSESEASADFYREA